VELVLILINIFQWVDLLHWDEIIGDALSTWSRRDGQTRLARFNKCGRLESAQSWFAARIAAALR